MSECLINSGRSALAQVLTQSLSNSSRFSILQYVLLNSLIVEPLTGSEIRYTVDRASPLPLSVARKDQFKLSVVVNDVMLFSGVRLRVNSSPVSQPLGIKAIKSNRSDLVCHVT
jgi:hypothetical protein